MTRKLSDAQKIDIVSEYSDGNITCRALGRKYGVTGGSIINILNVRNIEINNNRSELSRRYSLDDSYFDIINNEYNAYYLGLLYSDGNNSPSRSNISISLQEEDREILEKFNQYIKSDRPLEYVSNLNKKDGYIRKPQFKINISCQKMSKRLIELGCFENKSLTLSFPTDDQVPKCLLRHWLRGMWDGDGTYCHWIGNSNPKYPHFHVESSIVGTEMICNGIKDFVFNETGIIARIKNIKNKSVKRLKITKMSDVYNFMLWIYSDCDLYMKRKYNKCKEIEQTLYNSNRITGPIFFTNQG